MKKQLLYVTFCAAVVSLSSCKMELAPYSDTTDRMAFVYKRADSVTAYTFAYYSPDVTEGVVEVEVTAIGLLSDRARNVSIKQTNSGAGAAQAGVHYEILDNYVIEPNATNVIIPVKTIRDASLKSGEYLLEISLVANDDFELGYPDRLVKKIIITDILPQPGNWSLVRSYLGRTWGRKKHEVMIMGAEPFDVIVDEAWIDEIYGGSDYGLKTYWKNVFNVKLQEINDERALQGLGALREAPGEGQSEGVIVSFS